MDPVAILTRWPTRQAIADDTGRNIVTVHSWFRRRSIPSEMDVVLVEGAARRGFVVTFEELARARAPEHQVDGEPPAGERVA